MRTPNKSRSRNKNNRRSNNNAGNVLNRVHDSAGPEGKVRGTPQQVIDKYQALAHDSALSGDRVAMENFQQHAEHYIRVINEAQRHMAERREQEAQSGGGSNGSNGRSQPQQADPGSGEQPDVSAQASEALPTVEESDPGAASEGGLVETPETKVAAKRPARPRKPRPKPEAVAEAEADAPASDGDDGNVTASAAE